MALGLVFNVLGGLTKAKGQRKTGKMAMERGAEQKDFNEIAAQEMRAIGQHLALEEGRQAELMASRAVAVAAAGGSVMDIGHLIADIYGEGAYRASIALHDAESRARRLEFEGEKAEQMGLDEYKAAKKRSRGTLLTTLGTFVTGLD